MLKIEGVKYKSFAQSATADYLHGNLQDETEAVITYSLERVVFVSPDNIIWLTPSPSLLGSFDNQRIIYAADSEDAFKEFQVGDAIYISSTAISGSFTIEEKISDNTIRVAESLITQGISTDGEFIACTGAPKSLRYKYNIIGSDDNISYINHLDGEEQSYTLDNISTVSVGSANMMNAVGSKSHQQGSARLDYTDKINTYKLVFTITHKFRLFPFLKDSYIESLVNGTVIEDLSGLLSLNHIFQIDLLRDKDDETDMISAELIDAVGNAGSYNEHFNTGNTGYYVESVAYRVDGNDASALDIDKQTEVKITYKSDGKFTGSFRTEITFLAIHDDFDNYYDKDQDYLQNFCFASQVLTIASNTANGYKVFTGYYNQTIVDADTLEVTVRVFLGSNIKANINKSGSKRYALFISSEQNGLSVANMQRSRDLIALTEFVESLPSLNMVSDSTDFWLDPADQESGYIAILPELFMTDDVVAVSKIMAPKATPISLVSIKNEIVAVGTKTVILDSATSSLSGFMTDSDGGQMLNVSMVRPLNQSYKTTLTVKRSTDNATHFIYDMSFPFVVGYRDDLAIVGQQIPSEVYNFGTTGNGLSCDWWKYQNAGMSIYYRITYTFDYNGKRYTQQTQKQINLNDYSSPEWTTKSIKLYDANGDELLDGSDAFIKGAVSIVAKFDKSILPNSSDVECYFFINTTGNNGYRTSSTYDNTYKKIVFGSVGQVSGEIVCTASLDAEDFKTDVRIWCRLLEKILITPADCILISEEEDEFVLEDISGYLVPETCGVTENYLIDSFGNILADSTGDTLEAL